MARSNAEDDFLGTLTGTNMTYLAPERMNFEPAGKTSDIWAFGCLACVSTASLCREWCGRYSHLHACVCLACSYEICSGKRPWLQMKSMSDIIRGVPRRHHPLIVPLLKATLQRNSKHRSSARQILKCVACRRQLDAVALLTLSR